MHLYYLRTANLLLFGQAPSDSKPSKLQQMSVQNEMKEKYKNPAFGEEIESRAARTTQGRTGILSTRTFSSNNNRLLKKQKNTGNDNKHSSSTGPAVEGQKQHKTYRTASTTVGAFTGSFSTPSSSVNFPASI